MRSEFSRLSILTLIPLSGLAGIFSGTVMDPRSLIIPNVRVTLRCNSYAKSVRTDSEGRFEFVVKQPARACELSVTHSGFDLFRQAVEPDSAHLIIQLALAPMEQVVNVSPDPPVADPLRGAPLNSVSLSADDLKVISNNTADLISYAKLLSGETAGPDAIYVDGLPAGTLPPADMVSRITVNANPFSAEYSDGDVTHIDVLTNGPPREFRFTAGGASLGAGGHSPLAPGLQSESTGGNWGVTGPVPHSPLTFSAHLSLNESKNEVPILAVLPATLAQESGNIRKAATANGTRSNSFDIDHSDSENLRVHLAYSESRANSENAGVGGLTLPEAGSRLLMKTRELRETLNKKIGSFIYEEGLVAGQTSSSSKANAQATGVAVLGDFVTGGASTLSSLLARTSWTWRNVLRSNSSPRPWSAGITLSGSQDSRSEKPNPFGLLQFENVDAYTDAMAGADAGTLLVTRGNGQVRYTGFIAAPFIQRELWHTDHFLLTGGVRGDYESGFHPILSPRLAGAAAWRGFVIRSGGGLFARSVPSNLFLRVLEAGQFQQFLTNDVSFEDASNASSESEMTIHARFARGLTLPRELMEKASVERSFGKLTAGLDGTWARDRHLLGPRRLEDGDGWLDLFESDRNAQRNRLHSRLRYRWHAQSVAVNYEWIDAHDDGSGPVAFPEQQDNLHDEWARSAGVAPHNVSIAGSFRLPGSIALTAMDAWRSSAPYNIVTSLDESGDGLFNDRGGLPRNSGNGPAYNSLALYGYKRVPLPHFLVRSTKRMYLDLGIHADNLLGNKNYSGIGSVIGSPTFGRPLAASPGRSIRLWMNLD